MPKIKIEARLYYWTTVEMVPGPRPSLAGQQAYLRKEDVETLAAEVHRQGFEAGVTAAASEVRRTPIRPG